jgi:eukaryotic-like serine/threonine-protein kinase
MSQPAFKAGDELGHYRLSEKIGKGGQGEVWLARDLRFDRDVAVKILPATALTDEAARTRFQREARAIGKLNHPNIATAHDFGEEPVEYLVTEYVAGSGLDEKLAGGALPEDAVLVLGGQLAAGLEAAHKQGIIHRDLKPGNLRITHTGTLKILDFGLAEMFDPTKDAASMDTVTINMTLTGTLPYMSPEQFSGMSDQRSDLWSAGAVIYEMATGKLPFPETKVHEVRDAILNRQPPPPRAINPQLSPALELVILRCLQKKPERRYQTATELREDLERLKAGVKTSGEQRQQERRFAVGALAAVLLLSGLVLYRFGPQIRQKLWPSSAQTASEFQLLAILPVDSGGQDPSEQALVRGMAETVSAHIARATQGQKLQLIPPNELISQGVKTTEAARREFGVQRVLEVAVQRSGGQLRVTCSLIDSQSHKLLNACTVTGKDDDLFALQDKLVGEVVAMLPQNTRKEQGAPTEVEAAAPQGYEYYLKGRGYLLEYQNPENIDAAIQQFEQALKANPNYALAYAGLGEAYWRGYEANRGKQWLDLASTNCEKSLNSDSRLAEAHTCLGNVYNDTGRYERAVDEFKHALATDKSIAQTFNGLGKAYSRLGKTAEAEKTYKQAIASWPQYWAVYNWLGQFYWGQARYADAASAFCKVIELRPDNQRGYNNLGAALAWQGKYDEAIESLNRSIKLRPTMSAYSNLGAAYFWQRRYAEAISAFEKARDLDEQDYMNWGNLGDALYWSTNRRPEASAAYNKAIGLARGQLEVNPIDSSALAFMAQYRAMVGDKPMAKGQIERALSLTPKDGEAMFRAALVYNQFGDRRRTLDWLKKAANARYSRTVIRDTPDFAPLQSDPEFSALITEK